MLIASLILLQIIIFAALIFILKKVLTQNITSATRHLDELSQDYTKKETEVNQKLEEVERKYQEILAKAQEEAAKVKAETIKTAEDESSSIVKQARTQSEEIIKQADRSRQMLISEIEERIGREAVNKAAELIGQVLPEEFRESVHSRWVEELVSGGFAQLERLRVPEDTKEVVVTSAFRLNEKTKQALAKRLKEALGRDAALKEEIDPRIVAGIIITIGSLVLDGSLKNKIKEQAKNAKDTVGG